jgi:hypothetical protein
MGRERLMPRKKKVDLPVFAIVDMPKWKAKICDIVVGILFPGEKYFVLTIQDTYMTTDGKGKYTDDKGTTVEL